MEMVTILHFFVGAIRPTPQIPPTTSPNPTTVLTELQQDFSALKGITERLDSTVMTEADTLSDARTLLRTIIPVLEAIAAEDNKSFTNLKPTIMADIEDYRTRVSALRETYGVTTKRRKGEEDTIDNIHTETYSRVFDHQGSDHDPLLALQVFQTPTDDPLMWQRNFQEGKKTVEELQEGLQVEELREEQVEQGLSVRDIVGLVGGSLWPHGGGGGIFSVAHHRSHGGHEARRGGI